MTTSDQPHEGHKDPDPSEPLNAQEQAPQASAYARSEATYIDKLSMWAQSENGIAFLAALGLFLFFGTLWLVNDEIVNANQKPQVAASADQQNALQADLDAVDPVLALIKGAPVTLSSIEEYARQSGALAEDERLTAVEAIEKNLVAELVDQRLLAMAAREKGVAQKPDVQKRLAVAQERILSAAMLDAEMDALVTDDVIREIYNQQRTALAQGDEVLARHIVLEDAKTAVDLMNALNQGVEFEDVVETFSDDRATKFKGGNLGYFTYSMVERPLAEAAFNTKIGEYAELFQTSKGWHILQVQGRRPVRPPSFKSSKPRIEQFLQLKAVEVTTQKLREEGEVVFATIQKVEPAKDENVANVASEEAASEEKTNEETLDKDKEPME